MPKETITKSSTKNEIFDAYESMLKKVADLENMKPQEIREKEEKQVLIKKVSEMTPDTIVRSIADLKLKVAASFDQVEDSLLAEQKKLADIRQAMEVQKTMIAELYQVKVTADSLAAMLLAHKEKKLQLEAESQELKMELDQKREEFDGEMTQKKADWDKEKLRIQSELKEDKERARKEHQREEEEYNYNLQLKRRKEQDEYTEKHRKAELEFAAKTSETGKALQEREEAIVLREQEFNLLHTRVAKFEDDLAKAVKEAEKSATDKLNTRFGFEKELLLKEHEGLLKLKDQTIQTLENRIKEQESYVKQLTQKTDLADRSVKDIAIKAIESSAKVQLFETPAGKKAKE
ncbi:MAG: hypothetical protein M0Q38_01890 [Bacteroidales bacterium]|jgi:hypothetical protein|nr:hypothetical protein [Bacteroidales bacterium]